MLTIYINWLVVSQFQPLWKIWKSVGVIIPNIWKTTKCSKPPTSLESSVLTIWLTIGYIMLYIGFLFVNYIWLVVYLPLWKIWVRQLPLTYKFMVTTGISCTSGCHTPASRRAGRPRWWAALKLNGCNRVWWGFYRIFSYFIWVYIGFYRVWTWLYRVLPVFQGVLPVLS